MESDKKEKIVLARKSNQTKTTNTSNKKAAAKKKNNAKSKTPVKKSNKNGKNGKAGKNSSGKKKKANEVEDDDSDSDEFGHLESKVLPGQKFSTPPKGEPVRAFYESLIKTNPNSEMAIKYCVEYGCLSKPEAELALKKLDKINKAKVKK